MGSSSLWESLRSLCGNQHRKGMMATLESKQFGKYFLLEKLALGGMAEIYKAKTFGAEGFEKLLAIKRILPHCAADKEFITMLIDEAKLSVLLSHANIVQVYDLGKVGEDYFIAMEFINGINLRDILAHCRENETAVPTDLAVYIASEICKGLDYAHRKADSSHRPLDIVHRDVSPQNVLISYEGEVKIVDFGIAKAAMNISHTMAGILKGKIAYMSPEQAMGKQIDRRTDIFSAGILLYEMLTGERLYTGESQFEVLKKIRTVKIDAGTLPQSVPHQLRPVLARALSFTPESRFQSAGDLQVELTKFLYAIYLDFSPRNLAKFIGETFRDRIQEEAERAKRGEAITEQTASINIVEGAKQIDIVHGSTPRPKGTTDEITAPSGRIRKKKKGRPFVAVVVTMLLFLGIGVGAIQFFPALRFWEKASTPPSQKEIATPEKEPSSPPPDEAETANNIGVLNIISDPSGAAIMLEGRLTGLLTPATVEKLPLDKELRITLTKPEYQDVDQTITLKSASPQKISSLLQPIKPQLGGISITSSPVGATILMNGKSTGEKTPATIPGLALKEKLTVALSLEGYESWSREIILSEPRTIPLDATLQKTPPPKKRETEKPKAPQQKAAEKKSEPKATGSGQAEIRLASNPSGADVFINAEHRGKTPLSLSVTPGTLTVLVSTDGKAPYSKNVTVSPGETVNLTNIVLPDLYGVVSIVTTPAKANVIIDGQKIPFTTPVTIDKVRTDRPHTLTLQLRGYQDWTRNFNMTSNKTSFNVILEKK